MIGGFFPFSTKSFPVNLTSGGTYYPPNGQYIVTLGRVSILQWQDPWGIWRACGLPGATVQFQQTGPNFRILNNSGTIVGATITTAGSAGTNGIGATATGASVSFGSAPSSGRAATAYCIVGGSINSTITITTAGTGLLVPPLLVFDPPPLGGIPATARCTLTSGTIGAVTVTNPGAGYQTAPNCYVIPQWGQYPGGTIAGVAPPNAVGPSTSFTQNALMQLQAQGILVGAWTTMPVLTVNATLAGDASLTGVVMLDYGANYTSVPSMTFTGAPTSAAATALGSFSLTSVSVNSAGAAVSVAPDWQSSLGLVAATDGAHDVFMIRKASGISTLSSTTTTIITSLTVEDPGYGLQKVPDIGFLPTGGTAYTTIPSGTAVVGGISDTSMLQPTVL